MGTSASHLLIIGGSDAGISAAVRAREADPAGAVTVVVADHDPNHSICGLPFWLAGMINDQVRQALAGVEGVREGTATLLDEPWTPAWMKR